MFIIIPLFFGYASAAFFITVGISSTLLFPFIPANSEVIYYAVILYVSSFLSYYFSPIHLCQVFTNEYFCIEPFEGHKMQFPIILSMFFSGVIIFIVGML